LDDIDPLVWDEVAKTSYGDPVYQRPMSNGVSCECGQRLNMHEQAYCTPDPDDFYEDDTWSPLRGV
jgi:hypothetical protein